MHVPWGWIRQRPHFLAEGLARHNNLHVVYERSFRKNRLITNKTEIDVSEIFRLPIRRYSILYFINVFLVARSLNAICRKKDIDIIWITDVILFAYVKNLGLDNVKIVCDCMDETLEFSYIKENPRIRKVVRRDEAELVRMCEHVFCSSRTIMKRIIERTHVDEEKLSVVHNALDSKMADDASVPMVGKVDAVLSRINNDEQTLVVYVGTISEWLDLDCIIRSLRENSRITYLLVGPADVKLPALDRLIAVGPVEHQYVGRILDKSDILVMPFKLNALIEAVDPVKLYEYIPSGKPIIATAYEETRRFSEYVYLYETCDEYVHAINDIVDGKHLKGGRSTREFAEQNTWQKRVDQIQTVLETI